MSEGQENLPKFGEMTYWDNGYKDGSAPAEWFVPYSSFSGFVEKKVAKSENVLVIGCGTSTLSVEMFDHGYQNLESMDYSPEAIAEMSAKYPRLKWSIMDVRSMTYHDQQFDSVVDKGTFDCLFFLDETNDSVQKMLKEVYRVLKPKGKYIVVTCGHPMQRCDIFTSNRELHWKVADWEEYEPPDGSYTHPSAYVYHLQKE